MSIQRDRFTTTQSRKHRRTRRGATMLEYVILVACIAVPALAAYAAAGPQMAAHYVSSALSVLGLGEQPGE